MLQSLYKCQRNLCAKIRKTSLFVQFVSTSCGSHIPTDASKSLINLRHKKSHSLSKIDLTTKAQLVQLDTAKCSKVSALIEFLRNHGFSEAQTKKLIRIRPQLLGSKLGKTLNPKLKFLQSIGFSEDERNNIVCCNPSILFSSIEKQLTPSFDSLKIFMGSKLQAMTVIKRSPHIFNNIPRSLKRTVQVLHQLGIPDSQLPEFISKAPIVLSINPKKMSTVGLRLKEMGFDVTSPAFRAAFAAMSLLSHSKMESKLETYRSMGFSDDEILNIFRSQPTCMFYSEDSIRRIVAFYVDRLHWSLSYLSQKPVFLLRSLERRVIPRCSVMQVLWSRGIISEVGKLSSILMVSEKEFLQKYVTKYEAEVPDLQAAYHGKLMFNEYSFHLHEIRQIPMSKGSSPKAEAA
ncbi:hypothetical protein P3S68_017647 [Capsicum galapagoense]